MPPIIELDRLSFSYGEDERFALRELTLTIEESSFVGVIGPSGAGKTTLASVLSGAIPHHFRGRLFGAARVDGHDTCEVNLTDISATVGSVLQDIDAQMVAAVVEDELLFGLENFGVPHEDIEARMRWALDTVGIAELRHREIATLSGGQKQKVAIAAILALRPRVLVLDEPTSALDPASAREVFETLRAINRETGVTVVVIEQMVALLSEFCGRVVVLDGGTVALDGTPREVFGHAEELRRIGVDSPRVTRISNSLAAEGLCPADAPCLTLAEAQDLIEGIVGARGSGPAETDDSAETDPVMAAMQAETPAKERTGEASASTEAKAGPGKHAPQATAAAAAKAETKTGGATSQAASMAKTEGVTGQRIPQPASAAGEETGAGKRVAHSASAAEPAVRLEGVCFSYPDGGASVDGVSLEVLPGETLALVGQNGAGKTTVTKLLNGLLSPSAGTVRAAGLDVRETPVSTLARHVATLFQNPDRQLCKNTVLEEVAFGLELHGMAADEARKRASAVIERFGLPAHEAPFSLSRGQRQMVALASVVVLNPAVVILDEPTSGLDYRECMTVMETVRDLARNGAAVVMVCHDMEVVSDFADRVAVMADGRVLACGTAQGIFAQPHLVERARVTPPQVIALAEALAANVSPAFSGLTEVSDVVSTVKELSRRA